LFEGNKAIGIIIVGVFFGFVIVMTSGLWDAVIGPGAIEIPSDIFITILILIILIVPFIFIMWPTKAKNEKKEGGPIR
jgi:NADH:ubiquinone oxidoreductase subunit 6 (subunit J)